jgi:hypothetical protein
MDNFANYIYLIFGIFILAVSQRHDYGVLNYSVTINYTILSLLGLEYLKLGIIGLSDICVHDIKWLCGGEGNYLFTITVILIALLSYDSASVFVSNKYYTIVLQKMILLASIYGYIFAHAYGYLTYYLISLISFNNVVLLIERIMFRNEFKFGTIHQRYVYICMLIYTVLTALILVDDIVVRLYELHYILVLLVFNYHFQLNLFYKVSCWEYCTFIRSGICDRLLLIVDYYEIPGGKV